MKVVKIFRMPDVSGVTGLKSSTIYKLVRNKEFPPPIKLTSRSSGWLSHEVDRWLESRLDQGIPKTDQTRAAQEGLPQQPDTNSPLQRGIEK